MDRVEAETRSWILQQLDVDVCPELGDEYSNCVKISVDEAFGENGFCCRSTDVWICKIIFLDLNLYKLFYFKNLTPTPTLLAFIVVINAHGPPHLSQQHVGLQHAVLAIIGSNQALGKILAYLA